MRRRGRARAGVELDPAAEHAHPVAGQRRRAGLGAQGLEQLAVLAALGLFLGDAGGVGIEQAGELREVDRRRVRQAADHLAGEVALDLLRLELAHELLQQVPRLLGRFAADADRGEEEAVALGDRQVQAHVAGDEVLELVADRVDQRPIGAEVLGARQRRLARGDALAALGPRRRRAGRAATDGASTSARGSGRSPRAASPFIRCTPWRIQLLSDMMRLSKRESQLR